MKKLLLAALVSLCVLPTFAQNANTVRFGVDPTFAPYESVDPNGNLVGIDIDVGNALCKKMKVSCQWVKINFDGVIPALNAKKIDGILSAMTMNEKRKKQVLFSDELYNSTSRMMLPKDKTLETTIESLKGKNIGIVQGTSQAGYANKHWQGKGINLVTYQNDERARQDLALGRIDATLQNSSAAVSFFETPEGANFHMSGKPVEDAEVFGYGAGIGLRLDDTALQGKVNVALKELHASGEFDEIMKRYAKYGLVAPIKK